MAQQIPVSFEFQNDQRFSNFLAGNNQEIIQHLRQLFDSEERQISLWGANHSGKTHLLKACCQHANESGYSSFYLDLKSIQHPEVLDGLEDFELVCLDNFEAIAGQNNWEHALFGFYIRHHSLQHKLVIASRNAINLCGIKLPDLQTRLNGGLRLKIQPLGERELMSVLQQSAEQLGFELNTSVCSFLLNHYPHDLAGLAKLLNTIDKASLSEQRKITIPFLKKILANP